MSFVAWALAAQVVLAPQTLPLGDEQGLSRLGQILPKGKEVIGGASRKLPGGAVVTVVAHPPRSTTGMTSPKCSPHPPLLFNVTDAVERSTTVIVYDTP